MSYEQIFKTSELDELFSLFSEQYQRLDQLTRDNVTALFELAKVDPSAWVSLGEALAAAGEALQELPGKTANVFGKMLEWTGNIIATGEAYGPDITLAEISEAVGELGAAVGVTFGLGRFGNIIAGPLGLSALAASPSFLVPMVFVTAVGVGWAVGEISDHLPEWFPGVFGPDGWFANNLPDWFFSPLIQWNRDPLTLDLDGDGIELVALNHADGTPNSTTYFDLDGNGFAERTGWVAPDDGLLVRDINRNGTVDSVAELFGNSTQDGFAVLETLDTNGDGKITAEDEDFGDLRVWRDLNQDGVSQANELFTLTELGIAEISVEATDVTGTNQGHDLGLTALFTRNDGTTGEATSIYFQTDGQDSVPDETGFTPSAAARLLPLNDNLQRQTHLVA